ncbi:MAG: hypothetical protein D6689_15235 [Deltaproteobacteria bacterium]|nr:MAG: hypothetical protein D6689_15235 [Deltaproteobacteria bacterium]
MRALGIAWAAATLAAVACGGGSRARSTGPADDTYADFTCNERHAQYVVVGGFVAPELGIEIRCSDTEQTIRKWTADDSGNRDETVQPLSRAEFDDVWRSFEDAGWRNLSDCINPRAKDTDEVYTFEIGDADASVTLTCQGKANDLPFPFDRLVNALDVVAAAH